jgi:N-dimethylarginine dimethylaminohydrolase
MGCRFCNRWFGLDDRKVGLSLPLEGKRTKTPTCAWIQNMLGLTVLLYFASEKWKWHGGHEYAAPVPATVFCLVREELLMLVDYCKSLVLPQVLDKKTSSMEVVHCC